jgi:choline kinase
MKAIIMAAGIGLRLMKQLGEKPKCCTMVGNETIIERMLRLLAEKGVRDIVLVLGYKHEVVREYLRSNRNVKVYLNPFFNITNSIASLWFARRELDGSTDAIIMNGDLFFEQSLLDNVVACQEDVVMFADPRRVQEADYRFAYEDGLLRRFGKELSVAETTGEYVGIAKLRRSVVRLFASHLDELIQSQKHGLWWEDVLYDFCRMKMPVHIAEITDCFWSELDNMDDHERIQTFVRKAIEVEVGVPAARIAI